MNTPIKIKEIKEGDLLLFRTKGSLFSWAIRVATGGVHNHIAIISRVINVLGSIDIELTHALGKGVQSNSIYDYLGKPKKYLLTLVRVLPTAFKDEQGYQQAVKTICQRAEWLEGKSYDWGAIAGLTWRCALRRLGLGRLTGFKSLLNRRMRFYCSELVCECWQGTSSICKHLFAGRKYHRELTPHDIAKSQNVRYIGGAYFPFINGEV